MTETEKEQAPEPASLKPSAAESAPAAAESAPAAAESAPAAAESAPAAAEWAAPEVVSTPLESATAPVVELAASASADSKPDASAAAEATGKEADSPELSFAEMFERAEQQMQDTKREWKQKLGGSIKPGQVVYAKVVGFSKDAVFLDVGAKAEGIISRTELLNEQGELTVKEGDSVEARVTSFDSGTVHLGKVLPHQSLKNRDLVREAHRTKLAVEGRVTGQNKGGFDVEIAGLRVFCPGSQMDLRPQKPENYVGKKFNFRVSEIKNGGRNIVVSRRVILVEENRVKAEETLKTLQEGAQITGTVTSVKDYGAFVDLGGVEGLVHLTEMAHGHLGKPSDVYKVGDSTEVKVLKIETLDEKGPKISLSRKALLADPWDAAQGSIKAGDKVTAKVSRIQPFGAFVEVLPGVDGLIHVSAMSLDKHVKDPKSILKEGDEVEATVVSTDWTKRRIGLSLVKTPKELADEFQSGKIYEGTVDRVESFGLFVKLSNGARGLVPASETGTERGTDLKKAFPADKSVKVTILEVEKKSGKIRLSIRRVTEAEERQTYAGYMSGPSNKKGGLGTFGDLFAAQLAGKSKSGK